MATRELSTLRPLMGVYLTAYPQQPGETTSQCLTRAYEAAKWSDPSVRQSLLEAETKKVNAAWQRRVDIDKAKNAGRVVKSRSYPSADYTTAPASTGVASWEKSMGMVELMTMNCPIFQNGPRRQPAASFRPSFWRTSFASTNGA